MRELNKRNTASSVGNNLEFKIPSWNQIYRLLLKLAEAVRKSGFEPDVIVGVSRGGWIPARIMSDLLETPKLAPKPNMNPPSRSQSLFQLRTRRFLLLTMWQIRVRALNS